MLIQIYSQTRFIQLNTTLLRTRGENGEGNKKCCLMVVGFLLNALLHVNIFVSNLELESA
jgi:hypothetical protein